MKSQQRHHAPYTQREAAHTLASVTQARHCTTAIEKSYHKTPHAALAYACAQSQVYDPYTLQGATPHSTGAIQPYHQPLSLYNQIAPSSPQYLRPMAYNLALPSPPKTENPSGQPITELNTYANHDHYFRSSGAPHYELDGISQSQLTQLALAAFPDAPATYTYPEYTQPLLAQASYTTRPTPCPNESGDPSPFNDICEPNDTSTHPRPMTGYTLPDFASSQPHSSYDSEAHAFPRTEYEERHASVVSSASHAETLAYQVADEGDGYISPGYNLTQQVPRSFFIAPTSNVSPAAEHQQRSSPPSATPPTSVVGPSGASSDGELEPPELSITNTPDTTLFVPEVKSQTSSRCPVDPQRESSEQREVINQPSKQTREKPGSANGRRRKLDQIEESGSESGSVSTPKTKPKERAPRYKTAYERVRQQRNFFESTTISLIHQVRILGGDPMQASDSASKGEEIDQISRILITSLQRDLEESRERVIEIQTELYRLREIMGDARHLQYPLEDEKAPLSAAPKTIGAHKRK